MFDVGFSELVLLAIVALVVLGPEKLPHAARILGAWVGRIRRTVGTIQAEIEREVAAQEMKTRLEKEFGDIGGKDILDELRQEQRELENSLRDPTPAPPTGAAPAANPVAAETNPPSVLAQAATPPDAAPVDGEKAYREWLEAQRRKATPADSAPTPGHDTP